MKKRAFMLETLKNALNFLSDLDNFDIFIIFFKKYDENIDLLTLRLIKRLERD